MGGKCNSLKNFFIKIKNLFREIGKYNIYTGDKWEDY